MPLSEEPASIGLRRGHCSPDSRHAAVVSSEGTKSRQLTTDDE